MQAFIDPFIEEIKILVQNVQKVMGGGSEEEDDEKKEGFLNQFDFNESCLLLTLVFVVTFMYKKEIMNMLNLK
jgi:hypothetical protein